MIKETEETAKKVYEYINDRVSEFYTSTLYNDFWNRCERREKAYYFKRHSKEPVWRSKLYFGIFFMGCKALECAFDQSLRNDPLVQVGLEEGRKYDPAILQKVEVAHFDLNHDLYMSRFKEVNQRIQWYCTVLSTGVGREFFTTNAEESEQYEINYNAFGEQQERLSQIIARHEHTVTEAVDPRNFAHDPTKSDFWQSKWASVRYPLPVCEIYKMLGDDRFYQPGVKELIEKIEGDGDSVVDWSSGKDTYYSMYGDQNTSKNSIIIDEYSGDLNYSGNFSDTTLYYCMIVRKYNLVLAFRRSPFRRHPYWKERAYPDPAGPYGVDPCAPLLPIGYLKNNVVNNLQDMVNSSLKYQYEVCDELIRGGATTLLSGLPGGLLLADDLEAWKAGPMIRPVKKEQSVPYVGDLIKFISEYEKEIRPASAGRGKESSASNTATEIGVMAQREDQSIASMQDKIDYGIEDAMGLKMDARTQYATQPIIAQISSNKPPMSYFPRELGGTEFTYKVQRMTPDIQAGKYISFLKLVMQGVQLGFVNLGGIAKAMKVVGRNMSIDEVDEIINDVNGMPPMVGASPGIPGTQAPGGGLPPAPGGPAAPAAPRRPMAPAMQGAMNARP